MDLGDVVISKDLKRHIVTAKKRGRFQLVCVKSGTISMAHPDDLYYYKPATALEVITAYENGQECRELLESLSFAKEFLANHEHRGDDIPSMIFRI